MTGDFEDTVNRIAIAGMRVKPLTKIDVSEDIFIRFDPEDTWLGIYDKDDSWYDGQGYVIFSNTDLDKLILTLQNLRKAEARE